MGEKPSSPKNKKYYKNNFQKDSDSLRHSLGLTASIPSNALAAQLDNIGTLLIPIRCRREWMCQDSSENHLKEIPFIWSQIQILGDYLFSSSNTISSIFFFLNPHHEEKDISLRLHLKLKVYDRVFPYGKN